MWSRRVRRAARRQERNGARQQDTSAAASAVNRSQRSKIMRVSRARRLATVGTALALMIGGGTAMAPPASATATGVAYVSSHEVPYRGVSVPIPAGMFAFTVQGDNRFVDQFYGGFLSSGVTSYHMDVTVVDHDGRTIETIRGESHHSEQNVVNAQTSIPYGAELPENANMVCGEMFVRGAPVVHHCHKIFNGWKLW